MRWISQNRWMLAWIAVLAVAWAIRLHNAFAYNPYWGYDGGAHLAYVRTIADRGRLPTPEENYQAWHAPLFYIISAGIFNAARLIRPYPPPWIVLQIFQAILGTAFVGLSGALAWEATRRRPVALATAATFAVLPLAVFAGSYVSNELAVHVLILGVLILAVRRINAGAWTARSWLPLGLLIGVAFLIKYSAALLVPALVAVFAAAVRSKRGAAPLAALAVALASAFILALPWQIYRARSLGGAFGLNSVEEARARTLEIRGSYPAQFFLSFDPSILDRPFWDSGSRGIWSMLFAQVFADHDNIFSNVDRDNSLPSSEKILTTSGRYVSVERFAANRSLIRFSFVFVPLIVAGLAHLTLRLLRTRLRPSGDLLLAAFAATALAATIAYAIRYPFIERGTIKAIYVLSAIPIVFIRGWSALFTARSRWIAGAAAAGSLVLFAAFAWPVIWIGE